MAGTSENNVATAELRHKWVTFHDEMDDAMEGGYRKDHEIQERRKPQRSTTLASLSSDKYAAFSKLDKVQGRSKGWSGKVSCGSQGGGPMGWSDEILGLSTDDDEEAETEPKMHLNIEDNWGGGNPLHRSTWDRSPNRSFVRNFP